MKLIPSLLITVGCLSLVGCCTLSRQSSQSIALFNGTNLDGWIIENDGQFSVKNGVIKVKLIR